MKPRVARPHRTARPDRITPSGWPGRIIGIIRGMISRTVFSRLGGPMSEKPPVDSAQKRSRLGSMAARLMQPKVIVGLVITVFAVWFMVANNSQVRLHFWVVWVSARLWTVLAGTFVAGLIVGFLSRRRTKSKK
jgi:uncharacterized integral membrane protein